MTDKITITKDQWDKWYSSVIDVKNVEDYWLSLVAATREPASVWCVLKKDKPYLFYDKKDRADHWAKELGDSCRVVKLVESKDV